MKPSILSFASCLTLAAAVQATPASADLQTRALLMATGRAAPVFAPAHDNTVTVRQTGNHNRVVVRQHGSGHSADITQLNGNNTLFVVQTGRRSSVTKTQHGGEHGFIFVYGH